MTKYIDYTNMSFSIVDYADAHYTLHIKERKKKLITVTKDSSVWPISSRKEFKGEILRMEWQSRECYDAVTYGNNDILFIPIKHSVYIGFLTYYLCE